MGHMPAASGVIAAPLPKNEPVFEYEPGSKEREKLQAELRRLSDVTIDMPLLIGGREVRTGQLDLARMPHAHSHVLGYAHLAGTEEIFAAIAAAEAASQEWSRTPWTDRAAIFLRAADILAGP